MSMICVELKLKISATGLSFERSGAGTTAMAGWRGHFDLHLLSVDFLSFHVSPGHNASNSQYPVSINDSGWIV